MKVYNAEVIHPDLRGFSSTFYPVLLATGVLVVFLGGYMVQDYTTLTGVLAAPGKKQRARKKDRAQKNCRPIGLLLPSAVRFQYDAALKGTLQLIL